MAGLDGYFSVACCKRRRGLLPGGILICSICDGAEYRHPDATIPNAGQARDMPADEWYIYITKRGQ
jgi:hypothetical protein